MRPLIDSAKPHVHGHEHEQQRAISGRARLEDDNLSELSTLLAAESAGRRLVLDLQAVRFLRECERDGIVFRHCPAYIRAWMAREGEQP